MSSEGNKLLKALKRQGFEVARTGGGHWKVTAPDGRFTVIAFSPRNRNLGWTKKHLRELGFKF